MRLGLVARMDSRGLGIQTKALYDHLHPAKTLVIPSTRATSERPLRNHPDWYPDGEFIDGWPTPTDYGNWLPGLDTVITCETPYHPSLFTIAEQLHIRTVMQPNYELWNRNYPHPSLYAAPTKWYFDDLPDPKTHLPMPVATEDFRPDPPPRATNFLHVIGRPAIHDRNGTTDLLLALQHVRSEITLTLRCQQAGYVHTILSDVNPLIPPHITLRIEDGDLEHYTDLYTDQHVLVLPRRFGGLCLPAQEAVAAGMPVVMTDVSPNNDWLPADWLVPANNAGTFVAHNRINLFSADAVALADAIDRFTAPNYYRPAVDTALDVAKELSWDNLLPIYRKVLNNG